MKIGTEWMSISDMMSGLMMIFLFIGVSLMMEVQEQEVTITEIKLNLDKRLNQEFAKEFEKWGIEEVQNNIVRFNSPSVSFGVNEDVVSPEYQKILEEFYPRYIEILTSNDYKQYIRELRIEGHTDSAYYNKMSKEDGFIYNIDLSQRRSKNVLAFLTTLEVFKNNEEFIQAKTRVNGVGSAEPVIISNKEDKSLSRRVDFKVVIEFNKE